MTFIPLYLQNINYMMKSLDARKQGLDIKQYEKEILTPNEIDDFLAKIEELDSKEPDNSKRKILSDTKTTIAVDEDGKKILQSVPSIEGNIPRINHQIEKNDDRMMDIFLLDAIQTLKSDKDLSKHVEFAQLMSSLDKMYESTRGVIPFEVWVRNRILTQIKAMGIEENKYTAVNAILRNTEILSLAKENPNGIDILITRCLKEKTSQLIELGLTQEQTIEAISNLPELLYDEKAIQKIQFYQKHRPNHLKEYIAGNNTTIDEFIDTIIILQSINVDTSQLAQRDTIESLAEKSGVRREQIKVAGLNLENKIGGDRDRIVQAYRGNVKYKKPTDEQVKELLKLGISLEERNVIQEFIEKIRILKGIGVDTDRIVDVDTIESLAKKSGISLELIKYMGLDPKDKIGGTRSEIARGYRGNGSYNPPTKEQVIELLALGISLEKEERNAAQEFIEKLRKLQSIRVDTSKLTQRDTIESLAKKSGVSIEQIKVVGLNPKDKIGISKNNIALAYRGSENGKPPTEGQVIEIQRLGISLEKEERNIVQEFIKTIRTLQNIHVDTHKLVSSDTIQSLAEKSGVSIEQIKEAGLNPKEKIGGCRDRIVLTYRGKRDCKPPTEEQVIELLELGISLEETNASQEFIEKIKKLQSIGVDTNKLVQKDTIESLAKKSEIGIPQIKEAGLSPEDKIGNTYNGIIQAYRGKGKYKPPTEEQVKELLDLGISLEKEERNVAQEFIEKIKKLKSVGVDIIKLTNTDTIESLAKKSGIDIEQIIGAGLNPEDKIGNTNNSIIQAYRGKGKYKPPTEEQVKELLELGIRLEKEEKNFVQEFIEKLRKLQSIGVDVSQLAQRDTIESLAKKSGVIIEQIKVVELDPKDKLGIDRHNIVQAYRGNGKYKKPTDEQVKELQELGISLDYRDTTCEYVSVLKILKNNNINLEGLKVKSKIKDLIEGNPDENIIKQELLEISPEIDDGWNIGQRLFVQRKTYYDEFKIKLMNAISEGVQFTEKEIHILLDRDRGKDKSNSEEVIGFMRSIISEQKNVGELGENENLRTAFEATIKVSEERAIDQEKGEQ